MSSTPVTFNSKLEKLREKALYYSDTRGDAGARDKLHCDMFALVEDMYAHAVRANSRYAIQEMNVLRDLIGDAGGEIDTTLAIDAHAKLWGAIPDDLE